MNEEKFAPAVQPVALVCGEPRLRRILRLALEVGGYVVLDYADDATAPAGSEPAALVIDLDSLHWCPGAVARMGARGALDRLPAVCISIYPTAPEDERRQGPTEYLQPPFPADELVSRLRRLLTTSGGASTACAADNPPSQGS